MGEQFKLHDSIAISTDLEDTLAIILGDGNVRQLIDQIVDEANCDSMK